MGATALEALALVVARPWLTGKTTAAALIRKIDKAAPTLLLDESDAAFKGDREYAETLRGVLNTGHRRGGVASLCVGQGAAIEVRDFQTFCPKAIAGIGRLPDTVADRAITIAMKRRAPGEAVERFRQRDADAAARPLREGLAAWALAAVPALRDARTEIPDQLGDRAADGWEPLLAVADAAGGDWPERARRAAGVLSGEAEIEDASAGVRLLADIRATFEAAGTDRLASADLAARLAAVEEAPWGAFGRRDRPLDARALARLLAPYGVKPRTIRLRDGQTAKGYTVADFGDAWSRYLTTGLRERHTVTPDSDGRPVESETRTSHRHTPPL
jgi:hypothetical protein